MIRERRGRRHAASAASTAREIYAERTLLKREVLPEHCANAVFALVGPDLTHITGLPALTEAARAANFTNEGGVDGCTRFLTDVMGTWLLSETLCTWDRTDLASLLAQAADHTGPVTVFDVQDPRFPPTR